MRPPSLEEVAAVLLNPESPCAACGKPTVRGVNSDFCSATCEDRWEAVQRGDCEPRPLDEDPASPFVSEEP